MSVDTIIVIKVDVQVIFHQLRSLYLVPQAIACCKLDQVSRRAAHQLIQHDSALAKI